VTLNAILKEGGREGGRERGREGGREGGSGRGQEGKVKKGSCFEDIFSSSPPLSLPPALPFSLPHIEVLLLVEREKAQPHLLTVARSLKRGED
jgi:hypothetical protein